jgi:hypothetical protein
MTQLSLNEAVAHYRSSEAPSAVASETSASRYRLRRTVQKKSIHDIISGTALPHADLCELT